MNQTTIFDRPIPGEPVDVEVANFRAQFEGRDLLDQVVRRGAQQLLQQAIESEVQEFLQRHDGRRDGQGNRLVVRNGYKPARKIVTGAGALEVEQPRVRDTSQAKSERVQFSSAILPPYLRRSKTIEEFIPWLYLKGISTGDFSEAWRTVYPETREQRCWVHKTANVLNNMPKSVQPRAKADLHEIWLAETRAQAHKAFDTFLAKYQAKYDAACECLRKDREELLTFYDFPAEHWRHLRTTNPIESTFATIRLRHRRTKGNGTRKTSLAMMFKLAQAAQKKWRRLQSHERLTLLLQGRIFVDGMLQDAA